MVRVGSQGLGDRAHHAWIESACDRIVGVRRGEWEVVVVGIPASVKWAVKIRGPAGFRYQAELGFAERNAESLERILNLALAGYDALPAS